MPVYKPNDYNSLSPYLVVEDAQKLVNQLVVVFNAIILRRYDRDNGKILHIELKLDDSVLMIGDSTEDHPAKKATLHLYVPEVFKTFERAIANGCVAIDAPVNKPGDPDTRGAFYDCSGNYWAVSTQTNP